MSDRQDHRVFHPGNARPRLRKDLRFVPQLGAQPYYLMEDPIRSKFYRLGFAEYTFVSLLDGTRTIDEALSRAATISPMACFTAQDGLTICQWLLEHELAVVGSSTTPASSRGSGVSAWQRWNPLILRLPLWRPDGFFRGLAPLTAWFFRWPVVMLWGLLIAAAIYQTGMHWEALATTSQQIFSASNWLWLGLAWLLLKVIHECAHGVVCKRYGGTVREAGVLFILFAPLAFVDVTSSWRFRDKWPRIWTAAAGMYVETFLAAVALLLWVRLPAGRFGSQLCLNVATMASISTILFNANPLMRFDGYYMLSDWLGIPNLYTSGQQYLMYLGRRYALGMSPILPRWSVRDGVLIRLYGVSSFLWRIMICVALIVAASTMFAGAGLALSAIAVVTWFGRPLLQFVHFLSGSAAGERPRTGRFLVLSGSALTALAVFLLVVPWPGKATAPALVTYEPLSIVRADSDGFISEILVADGELVEQGQPLVVLENDDLQLELADLGLQIRISKLRALQHEKQQELGSLQVERGRLRALKDRFAQRHDQVAQLTLLAPTAGMVVAPELSTMLGRYVREGEEILSVGDESRKELKVSIAQRDVQRFRGRLARPLAVWLPGRASLHCPLSEVTPRASAEPPAEALCASYGGPLAVELDAGQRPESPARYQFLRPRFTGYVSLTADQSRTLRAGQLAVVSFSPLDESVGRRLYRWGSDWLERQLESASR